ncbi:MAG: flagellar basal-body rod protein FlgF [Burkholderiales bacterium]|nr:flagellar basal-body rod protein FlgF [Burkholderiales bacterium]
MDRIIYTALSGAKALTQRQDVMANNVANANTPGFRAQVQALEAVPVKGEGMKTRAQTMESTVGSDFSTGPVSATGRKLDIAIEGDGWIAVEGLDGQESYTRSGALEVGDNGQLRTKSGWTVLGDGGPLTIPADNEISISRDGTVTAVPRGADAKNANTVGRIKLVNPEAKSLDRQADGLFRMKDGAPAPADDKVTVSPGALEGSNVSPVDAMVGMISLARQFETQMKLLQTAEQNDRSAGQLLSVNG